MPDNPNFEEKRKRMVKRQLQSRDIKNEKVLEAFVKVPREEFVPEEYKENAFEDRPLPVKEGQTISQPYIVAEMIQALEPEPEDKILEIGSGSGYACALMSRLVREVHGVERYQVLAEYAEKIINKLGYENIYLHVGDGTTGWEEASPYSGILVSAAAPEIPEELLKQLEIGGFLVIPAGNKSVQTLYQVKKISEDEIEKRDLGKVRFVPLVGEKGWSF